MLPERMQDVDLVLPRPFVTHLKLRNRGYDEAEVVQRLSAPGSSVTPMEREVIASGAQICVVGIRLPYHAHSKYTTIEIRGARDVLDI